MRVAFILMVLSGAAIGALLPARPAARTPAATFAEKAPTPSPTPMQWGTTGPPDYTTQARDRAFAGAESGSRPSYSGSGGETVIQRDMEGHFVAEARVNGTPVHFLVDTGADMVALSEDDARRAGIPVNPSEYRVIGRGASGDVRGKYVLLDAIELDGKRVSGIHGAVIEDLDVSLLGQSYLRQIGSVHMSGDTMRLR